MVIVWRNYRTVGTGSWVIINADFGLAAVPVVSEEATALPSTDHWTQTVIGFQCE